MSLSWERLLIEVRALRLRIRESRRSRELRIHLRLSIRLRIVRIHVLVVSLVTIVLLCIGKCMFWLLHINESWIVRVLVSTIVRKETIPNFLVEVLVVSHSTSSQLTCDLSFGSIKDSQELVTAALGEPDFDGSWCWNQTI